jgi:hypothetical protein
MLMRVATYTAGLAGEQNEDVISKEESASASTPNKEYTLLGKSFTTTLPWVAKEFMHLQKEAEKVKRLFLHPTNIQFLSDQKASPRVGSPSPIIRSSTDFSKDLIEKDRRQAVLFNTYAKNAKDDKDKNTYLRISDEATNRVADMKSVLLSAPQERALAFVNTRQSLVVLNIVARFTTSAIQERRI